MKTIKSYKFLFWLCIGGLYTSTAQAEEGAYAEKRKTIIKTFDVTHKDNLLIDNQFGMVKIDLWDKDEVRISIVLVANANSDERAQQYLDGVEIIEKKEGNQISVRTQINRNTNTWSWNNNSKEKNFLEINYTVSMPKYMALTAKNKFGNINIPVFRAPLNIVSKYGNFEADLLENDKNDIDIAYGKAAIKEMVNGNLDIAYGSLELEKAVNIMLINKFGRMHIGEVESLNGNISYSGARIGTIKGSSQIKLNFSGNFRIDQLSSSADNVDIQANYSSVSLPIQSNDFQFDITVSNGGFNYTTDRKVIFIQNDDDDKSEQHRYMPRQTKQYVGKIGRGTGVKLKVVSKYGEVNLK